MSAVRDELDALATRFADVVPFEFNTSPLYQALGPVVATDRPILELIAARRAGQQPTNLFFASLHYLVLRDREHPLREFFPSVAGPHAKSPEAAGPAMLDFCNRHRDELERLLTTRLVQTNVVKRAAALRLGLSRLSGWADSVHLVEIGASSGIHLLHDRYRYRLNDAELGERASPVTIDVEWRGAAPSADVGRAPATERRIGVDLHPIDAASGEDRLWLRALVWPENLDEADLLEAALDVVVTNPPDILEGDVIDLVDDIDAMLPAGEPRVVFHAATRAHVPLDRRERFDDAISRLGDRAPLAVISLESPARGDPQPSQVGPYHVLKVRRPAGEIETVAAVESHGDWIEPVH